MKLGDFVIYFIEFFGGLLVDVLLKMNHLFYVGRLGLKFLYN
jgi:hypothetical protein